MTILQPPVSMSQLPMSNSTLTNFVSNLPTTSGGTSSTLTNALVTGVSTLTGSGAVGAVANILGLDSFVNNTIGAVLENGFNLSCWGSTFTPKDAIKWAQTDFPKIYQLTIGQGLTTQNVQAFADILSWNYTQGIHFGNKMNDCSKKTLHAYANNSIKYRDEILNQLGSKIQILGDEKTRRSYKTLFVTAQTNFDTYDKEYITKKVSVPMTVSTTSPISQQQAANTANNVAVTSTQYGSNTGINPTSELDSDSMGDLPNEPKTKETGGFPWWLAIIFFI